MVHLTTQHTKIPTLTKYVMQRKVTATIVPINMVILHAVAYVPRVNNNTNEQVVVRNVNYVLLLQQIKFYLLLDL